MTHHPTPDSNPPIKVSKKTPLVMSLGFYALVTTILVTGAVAWSDVKTASAAHGTDIDKLKEQGSKTEAATAANTQDVLALKERAKKLEDAQINMYGDLREIKAYVHDIKDTLDKNHDAQKKGN